MRFRLRKYMAIALVVAASVLVVQGAGAETVTVAVASNFTNPFKAIVQKFEATTGHRVRRVSGSTGKLYAQILRGAPYDLFLAADRQRPELLETSEGVAGTRFTYARGRLVLWSADPKRIESDGPVTLRQNNFTHLALANPKTAPYGQAARSALQKLKLWQALKDRLVFGENIGQAFQFAATGNAELGFIARAQAMDPRLQNKGSQWLVPAEWHDPINQDALLLKHGADNAAARAFLDFLQGPEALKINRAYGYE